MIIYWGLNGFTKQHSSYGMIDLPKSLFWQVAAEREKDPAFHRKKDGKNPKLKKKRKKMSEERRQEAKNHVVRIWEDDPSLVLTLSCKNPAPVGRGIQDHWHVSVLLAAWPHGYESYQLSRKTKVKAALEQPWRPFLVLGMAFMCM
jgi:hypothetical protein